MNTHAYPTSMSTSERLSWHIILRLTNSPQAPRSRRKHLLPLNAHHWKSWNKSENQSLISSPSWPRFWIRFEPFLTPHKYVLRSLKRQIDLKFWGVVDKKILHDVNGWIFQRMSELAVGLVLPDSRRFHPDPTGSGYIGDYRRFHHQNMMKFTWSY